MVYTFRCRACGYEIEKDIPASEPLSETYRQLHGDCEEPLHRVWETPRLNLGFQPVKHTSNEEFLFKHC